jgi:hypothetical protein
MLWTTRRARPFQYILLLVIELTRAEIQVPIRTPPASSASQPRKWCSSTPQ